MASLATLRGSVSLSKTWQVCRRHSGMYSGGCVGFTCDGQTLASLHGGDVFFLDISSGQVTRTLLKGAISKEDLAAEDPADDGLQAEEEIVWFALHPRNAHEIVTASRNQLLRHWDLREAKCVRSIRAHEGPIKTMAYERTGTLCATGSADKTAKVWDIERGYCTHNFTDHTAPLVTVLFHPNAKKLILATSSEDYTVRLWDLNSSSCVAVLSDHMSVPKGITFMQDGKTLVTAGRDQVMNIYDLSSYKLLLTYPIYEAIESVVALPATEQHEGKKKKKVHCGRVAVAGSKGTVRIFEFSPKNEDEYDANGPAQSLSCKCILEQKQSKISVLGAKSAQSETAPAYTELLLRPGAPELLAVTGDHNFRLLSVEKDLETCKLFVGENDEIIDIAPIQNTRRVAVATNSDQVRIFDVDTFSVELLDGHSDTVLALDTSADGQFLTTVSKDHTGIIWCVGDGLQHIPLAVLSGHTASIGAVSMSKRKDPYSATVGAFVVTGSADKTIKRYNIDGKALTSLAESSTTAPVRLSAKVSAVAHDKDINTIAISPNDSIVATGSQDRTAKLWNAADLTLLGTLKGHKRAVWRIAFSPVDKCVATCSGDWTTRIWSVTDFSCLKTLQGHTAGVLSCVFISGGAQLITAGADGLLKLWNIRTSECDGTFDKHTEKVWTLTKMPRKEASAGINGEFEIISGGADSVINVWQDVTSIQREEAVKVAEENLLKEQELENSLRAKDYKRTAILAFELQKPYRLWITIQELINSAESKAHEAGLEYSKCVLAGEKALDALVSSWSLDRVGVCLTYCRDWNTSGRTHSVAQAVLASVLRRFKLHELGTISAPGGVGCLELVEGLIPYSRRHFQRTDKQLQSSYLLDYTLEGMRILTANSTSDNNTHTYAPMYPQVFPRFGSNTHGIHADTSDSEPDEHTNGARKKVFKENVVLTSGDVVYNVVPIQGDIHISDSEVEEPRIKSSKMRGAGEGPRTKKSKVRGPSEQESIPDTDMSMHDEDTHTEVHAKDSKKSKRKSRGKTDEVHEHISNSAVPEEIIDTVVDTPSEKSMKKKRKSKVDKNEEQSVVEHISEDNIDTVVDTPSEKSTKKQRKSKVSIEAIPDVVSETNIDSIVNTSSKKSAKKLPKNTVDKNEEQSIGTEISNPSPNSDHVGDLPDGIARESSKKSKRKSKGSLSNTSIEDTGMSSLTGVLDLQREKKRRLPAHDKY